VERVECTTKEMQRLIVQGDIDVALEVWKSNNQEWYRREVARGRIIDLGAIYADGHQFWVIPAWVAREYNIRTVADMRRHWQLFQDPEDSSKGLFFNCITGWMCLEINSVKLEAYGLNKFYNAVSPISPEALRAVFENAQLKRVPAFGYYWTPNSLMASYEWQVLEEPPYSEKCWDKVVKATSDKTLRPIDEACAYEYTSVHKFANQGFAGRLPDVLEVLNKMAVDSNSLSDTLSWAFHQGRQNWDDAAVYYLRRYPEQWQAWVTSPVRNRIEKALAEIEDP
jgi:glycine betaine/proline transport system substrate-binding protein